MRARAMRLKMQEAPPRRQGDSNIIVLYPQQEEPIAEEKRA